MPTPQRRASDPRIDTIEESVKGLFADLHAMRVEVEPMLKSYNRGTFPACALESQRIETIKATVDKVEKKVSGNGNDGLEIRMDRAEKFIEETKKLNLDVTIDRLVQYMDNQKLLVRALALVFIGQLGLLIWQTLFK